MHSAESLWAIILVYMHNANLFKAILVPVVFHAVYNFSTSLGFFEMFIVLVVMAVFAVKIHRKFIYEQSQSKC